MAEPGGIASKLGTQYERRYAIRQLVSLLDDKIVSLQWEPASADAGGADIDLVYPNGETEHIQLKRQNRANDKWSPSNLHQEGVLAAAAKYLDASRHARFTFVSSLPVPHLKDICDELTRPKGTDQQFIAERIRKVPKRSTCFDELLEKWELSPKHKPDELLAIRRLRAMSFQVVDTGRSEDEQVQFLVSKTLSGDSGSAIALLAGYLERHLGKAIKARPLLDDLAKHGHSPLYLSRDPQLRPTIDRLRNEFVASLRERLVAHTWIPRSEVDQVVSSALKENAPRFILVHGKPGMGKSGVLLGIADRLQAERIATLPLSLSAQPLEGDALRYGESLGLRARPAAALRAIARDDHAVLLVDQLDALRLATSGATVAWRGCAEMLREAVLDTRLTVIVACRTFDLEHDANIRRWRDSLKESHPDSVLEIDVGALGDADIRPILKGIGVEYGSLPNRLQKLLLHPGTLDAWYLLAKKSGVRRDLATQTQLLGELVQICREEAARMPDVTDSEVHRAIEIARVSMERSGKLTVPDTAFDECQAAMNACCSVGLFVRTGSSIGFPHQSYFDYLVARAAIKESGGDPKSALVWVKEDQSLERRDQLRQMLFLLYEQEPATAMAMCRMLLEDPDVRFHLKHLVLGVLREIDPIAPECIALINDLLRRDTWVDHVRSRVLWRSVSWFRALHAGGTWVRLLADSKGDERAIWLRLVLLVMESCPDEVDELVGQVVESPGGTELLGGVLSWWDPSEDSSRIADIRDAQVRAGKWSVHDAMLDKVAERDPSRLVRLIDSMVRGMLRKYLTVIVSDSEERLESLRETSVERKVPLAIQNNAVASYPVLARLVCICERVKEHANSQDWASEGFSTRAYHWRSQLDGLLEIVRDLTAHAVVGLAKADPERLRQILASFPVSKSISLSTAVASGLARSDMAISNDALNWLLVDAVRLTLRDRHDRDRFGLAAEVIRQHAGTCSTRVLDDLESALLAMYPQEEKDYYRHLLQNDFLQGRWGYYVDGRYIPIINPLGMTQHLLLGAIPENKRSPRVIKRLEGWDAKFGGPAKENVGVESRGGLVGSPIPEDRVEHVSDRQWLEIVTRDWGTKPRRWKSIGPDRLAESSHDHFANNFGTVAKRQPRRCLRLALRFPESAPAVYYSRLWDALGDKSSGIDSCELKDLASLLKRTRSLNDRYMLIAACRAIEHHSNLDWGDEAWDLLELAASHEDPEPEKFSINSGIGKSMQPDVEATALNCVRGVTAAALSSLMWEHPGRCARAMPLARILAADPHPAVRVAAAQIAFAAYTVDKADGMELLGRIIDTKDDRVLGGHYLSQLIRFGRWKDREPDWTLGHARGLARLLRHWHLFKWRQRSILPTLITRMSRSNIENVAQKGSHWATAERFQFGLLKGIWKGIERGSVARRKAAAETLRHLVTDDAADRDAVLARLCRLFNDADETLRAEAANVFRQKEILEDEVGPRLSRAFVRSKAFVENSEDLIWPLSHESVDLIKYKEVVFASADRFATDLAAHTRDFRRGTTMAGREQSSLLLRLYDAATKSNDKALASQCLDRWDALLENRVAQAEGHLEALST